MAAQRYGAGLPNVSDASHPAAPLAAPGVPQTAAAAPVVAPAAPVVVPAAGANLVGPPAGFILAGGLVPLDNGFDVSTGLTGSPPKNLAMKLEIM